MTAQIGDIYKRNNQKFNLIDISAPMLFNPRKYGFRPQTASTACWRGYWCEYNIDSDRLYLQNLYIYNGDNNYPVFHGVNVSPQTYHDTTLCYIDGEERIKRVADNMGHRVYRNVNLPIPYTGKILVGNDFLSGYYIHMGYQRWWGYKELQEFIFEEGILKGILDHSQYAEKVREKLKSKTVEDWLRYDVEELVDDIVSQDNEDKTWWLLECY